nr:WD repeat-containing protein 73-like [Penaeus vannamei]
MFDSAAESGDSEDEWFFQSIRRYEDLLMYDVQGVISCAVFRNDSRLLLASSREHAHEVWELSVPEKLTAGPDAGLTKDRDFSLITAAYTPNRTKEMLVMNSKVVLSGPKGVCIYNIPSSSDPTVQSATDMTNSRTSTSHKQVSLLTSSQINRNALSISSIVYRSGKLYVGLSEKGITYVYELGTGKVIQEITAPDTSSGFWKVDISHDEKFVAFANSNGRVNVYDTRKLSEAVFDKKKEVQDHTISNHQIQFSPSGNLLSLSGYSKLVEVFDVSENSDGAEVFCHDGHRGEQISTILTHLWHPSQSKLVFSADDMGTLQAWRFK